MNLAEKITYLQEKISKRKDEQAKCKGSLEILEKHLKDEFGISSFEEGEKKIVEWSKEVEEVEKQLSKEIELFEDNYNEYL